MVWSQKVQNGADKVEACREDWELWICILLNRQGGLY